MTKDDRWQMMYLWYKHQITKVKLTPKEKAELAMFQEQHEREMREMLERKQRREKKRQPPAAGLLRNNGTNQRQFGLRLAGAVDAPTQRQ